MNKIRINIFLLITILGFLSINVSGCATTSKSKFDTQENDMYFSLAYPVSLHPAITSGLNLYDKDKELGYDRDLLGLSSSVSKMFTNQISTDTSMTAGVGNIEGRTKRYRTTFDILQYASYPLNIRVPINDDNNCLYINKTKCNDFRTINIIPLIGAGVRVIAEYNSDEYMGQISLSYLSTKASASRINGTLEMQLLGVNSLGTNATGITQLNLTPDSIAMIQQQIAAVMSQMWNKNTIIQPQIVGYTILGRPDLKRISQSDVVDQLLKDVHTLSFKFFEKLLQESIRLGHVKLEEAETKRKLFNDVYYKMTKIDSPIFNKGIPLHAISDPASLKKDLTANKNEN